MEKRKMIVLLTCVALMVGLMTPVVFANEEGNYADVAYINGTIYTVDDANSIASAMAIKDNDFIAVGSYEEIEAFIGDTTNTVDLKGATVIPGIIESHLHYSGIGKAMLQVDAFWRPKEEILDAVKEAYENIQPGEWITGRGWNQEIWDPAIFPTKEDLDAVAPDVPVYLTRTCGHAAWVNSKALEIAEITRDTADPVGGEIIRDENGEATGVFTDTAAHLVSQHIPDLSERQQLQALELAQEHLLSYGITSAHDAGSGLHTINQIKELYESNDIKIRLYIMASVGETAEFFYAQAPEERIGLYNDRLTIRTVKLMGDGSLGARSAWMLEDYSDRPGHVGNGRYTDEEIYSLVKAAREADFQVSIHAIGDATNRQVLDTYERILTEMPDTDHRYRIEHAQIVSLEDIPRFAELGVLPSMQSVHATSDKNMAEDRVGSERIKGAYAWRKLLNTDVILPNGSDAPVELVNPYHGLYAAVTRMDRDGDPQGGWYPEEKMIREEALKSFTIWGAYASFTEDIKGSIEVGKLADFVVLDRDLMTCPASELKDILPLMTVLGGEVVYQTSEDETTTDVSEIQGISIAVNGTIVDFQQQPFIEDGRTLVPAKELLEAMELSFHYDEVAEVMIITQNDINLLLRLQDKVAEMEGLVFLMDTIPQTVDHQLFIPVKLLSNFGYKVTWSADNQRVLIDN